MKRIGVILLLSIYSLSIFGISLKGFYCCGKLKSVTVVITDDVKTKCNNGTSDDGCCKTKYKFFKVKDNHFPNGDQATLFKYFTNVLSFNPAYQNISLFPQQVNIINGCHAPPLHSGVPIYISHCVFRI